MEKNKGLFSFRKHPVGDFPDGEKGRKRKGGRLRQSMGFLMAAALVFNTLPASGLAVSASGREAGLCEHHRSHTADCGYMEEQPCTHEHTEECYTTVTECVHTHTDECYPETEETEESAGERNATASDAEDREPENCTHQCSEESGCITKVLDCHHEHDESCGYKEAQECSYVCEICNGTESEDTENSEDAGTDTAECICEILCTEDSINGDCPVCGAEGADLSACKGKEQGSVPEIDTGEKTEEQEKTGEKVIAAWDWIDPEEHLTDGMLALPGAGRENPALMEDVIALLPEKIQAEVVIVNAAEDGEETEEDAEAAPETEDAEITLTGWECASYPEDGAYEGAYTFTASLPEGFVLTEDAAALEVKVELGGAGMLAETVSASYQEASWNGSAVTYATQTAESCTVVESSTTAVTWTEGWYVVSNTVIIDQPITVSGAVNLILTDGCTLNASQGIVVTTGNSLTIYAQSGGTGTLNATGTTDSANNASAGIGGSTNSPNSGSITIHGGVINATGGGKARYYGGAGIGGNTFASENGGNSGTITIYGGAITANSGEGGITGAGIGGGGGGNGKNGGDGSGITIYGGNVTAASHGTQSGGAGIGGGAGNMGDGGAGNNIQINGGTVHATGGYLGAGIGGGGGAGKKSGDGNVTISGGKVTAVGGECAAGIGGGGGYQSTFGGGPTGGTGSVTISGGIVDTKGGGSGSYAGAPIGNGGNTTATATVSKTNAIVFENGVGTVCGNVTFDGSYEVPAGYSLHIPTGASLSGSGTLSGGGKFTTENLTEDMISVPADLYYNGQDRTEEIAGKVAIDGGITLCGQTFTVRGWTVEVEKTDDLHYTATYTNDSVTTKTFTKTITLQKSGTHFVGDGTVKTYKDGTECSDFTADDTITVKATPTATGQAPTKAAARLRGDPTAGQMVVFVGDTQVSAPADVGEDGAYTMTVSAADVLTLGGVEPNQAITLTAKFVGNNNMADAAGTVPVNISAVAKVVNGSSTTYVGNLDDAFKTENDGATITLLKDVTRTPVLDIKITCNLDLGGHTITCTDGTAISIWSNANLTIQGAGEVISTNKQALVVGGNVTLEGGTFTSKQLYSEGVYINSANASLSVTDEKVTIQNTGGGYGLAVSNAQSVQLSGGKYSGTAGAISIVGGSLTLGDLLAHSGDTRYAYFDESGTTPFTGVLGNKSLTGTVTVKECQHNGEGVCTYTHTSGTTTHQKTCLACGNKWDEENCSFGENGKCACEAVLAVALKDNAELAYTGEAQTPEVNVTVDGIALAAEKYQLSYDNNISAGNTAKVTVTAVGGSFSGSVSTTFTIEKAALTIKANDQAITYGGSITEGTGQTTATGLCTGDILSGITLTASTGEVPGGDITPYAAQIKNGSNEDVTANYDIVYETGKLTVSYMEPPAALLYNGDTAKGWYNGDVEITADGYTVSDTLGGEYKAFHTISAQEGTVTKTLYFKDAAGHMSGGAEVTVKFDLTPPTGEIAVGAKWWQNVLHFISFGNYAAKEYTVTIKAEDKKGSGISKIEYAIVTGTDQYTDADTLAAANLSWTEYNSGSQPTVPVSNSQYVVYARLTDNVGNVTYISTDGILLDNTPPTVGSLSVPEDTRKDVTAGFTFTVSEAADYYYVVLPKDSAAPSAEDIIVTCGGTLLEGTGTAISGTFPKGSGAVSADTLPASVSVEAENLSPNTAYTVYVTVVDRAVDITDSAEGTPAGNIAAVQNVDFTTKKTLPVITKAPAVAGTYGQSVGEMTVTGGTAQAGSTVLAGTWTVSDADKNEKPSAGTSEVTVIFKPDNADYDSVSVQASLAVSQRNLNAEGVTVSEVAGTYTYTGSEIRPPVAVGTGTPAAGIYISDSGAALTANDFTVSYSNHKDAGTASVTITGKGNYTGSVTRTFTIGKAPGREVPDVSGSMEADNEKGTYTYTVTPTKGAVYRMGNDGAWQEGNVFEGITPGTSVTFYAKMPETGNYEDGTPKSITVDFPKLTPAAPALSYKADRTNPADVKVTITPVSGAEYSFDGGKTWTESNEQGGFTTSQTVVLAIRLKETATHNQSPAQTVTVNLAKKDREAPPAFSLKVEANGETDYTVTIPATEGCEYSFDGEHWSDVNVKTSVNVGETVTGYKRYKETNDYNASSAVSAKETMPKFTVKTPVISPAGGSYSGSVSVTITCASPDAEIYYTTDGSAPGRGSTRYTGAFTVTAPATVKAIAVKDGLTDSAVASVVYTEKSGGGSGSGGNGGGSGSGGNGGGGNGNSGGNEDNGGQGSGTNPGNGSTTPQPSVTQPTDTNTNPGNETAPGTGTTPVNPGTGNTVRPGSGAGTPVQGTKQPFIKGEDGKIGWDVIRAEEEQAQEGSVINVDMNGSTVVPGDIFDSIKGKDIIITFDMGNGILWSVDGKSITADKAGDIDFSVKSGVKTVPVDIINNVTGENYSIQISLAYEGEFGFTAVLSIGLGKENAGYMASLYYYNENMGELEFICSDEVAQDGTVSLAFTHASDYVIAIDGEKESGNVTEPAQPDTPEKDSTESAGENPQNGQAWRPWWFIVVGSLVIVMGIGIFFAVRKKQETENS